MSSKQYFDDVAGQWDEMRQSFFPESVREAAVACAGVRPGKHAADIGAGSGFLTEALLAAGAQVTAVDQSQAMLDVLKAKYPAVEARQGDSEALPLPVSSMDHVLANMFLHHVERPAETIKAMVEVLKPGGKLVITDLDSHDFQFLVEEQHDRWMGFERADVKAWFEAAGLSDVVVDCADSDCCATSQTGGEEAEISIFIACGTKLG